MSCVAMVNKTKTAIEWVFPAKSGRFKDARRYETELLPGACPMCHKAGTVCGLPEPLLAEQFDGTTHVCNPALGGCNHGFAKEQRIQARKIVEATIRAVIAKARKVAA